MRVDGELAGLTEKELCFMVVTEVLKMDQWGEETHTMKERSMV